jgi:hypothetical protein
MSIVALAEDQQYVNPVSLRHISDFCEGRASPSMSSTMSLQETTLGSLLRQMKKHSCLSFNRPT